MSRSTLRDAHPARRGRGLFHTLAIGVATILVTTCESRVADPAVDQVDRVELSPQAVTAQPAQPVDFIAVAFTTDGDTADVSVAWSASAGTVTSMAVEHGLHHGRYSHTACGSFEITVTADPGGKLDRASVEILCPPPVASVTVSPPGGTLEIGSTLQLTATPRDAGGNALNDRMVDWTSSVPSIATVDPSGLVTPIAEGEVTILAVSEGVAGSVTITAVPVPVGSVAVSPSVGTVEAGDVLQLSATVRDASGNVLADRVVVWTTGDPDLATVNGNGLVTTAAVGEVTITATSDGKSGTAAVTIVPVPVASVTVSPAGGTMEVGRTLQLTATLRDAAGNVLFGRPVDWTTGDAGVATVSSTGLVHAIAEGEVTITAAGEGMSAAVTIGVVAIPVATVTVSPASGTIEVGEAVQLAATLRADDGTVLTGRPVVWITSDDARATVNSSGLVNALAAGPVTIIATSESQRGTASLTIIPVPVATVTVSPASGTIEIGSTLQLAATLRADDGTVLTGRPVAWTTSDEARATVNSSGLVNALAAGPVTITAASESQSGTASLTIVPVPVATVTVSPASGTIEVGEAVQLAATLRADDGTVLTGRPVVWITSDDARATVNSSGLVNALAAGPVTITAASESQSGTASLTIVPVPVATVTVSPASGTIEVGEAVQLAATLRADDGTVLTGRPVVWITSDDARATVNSSGLVNALAAGPVTIIATSESQRGTASLTIVPVPVATVTVSPVSGTIEVGETIQLAATLRDDDGTVLTGRSVVWSSSDEAGATVNSSGLVHALATGPVTITATSEGQSGTASLTIIPVPVATVTVSPVSGTIEVGETIQLAATLRAGNGDVLAGRPVAWSTSDPAITTVTTDGLVLAVSEGPVTITATSEGQSGTASLTIIPVPVATVTVSPVSGTIEVGETIQLAATLRDDDGTVLTGRPVVWSSSDDAKATVNSSGLVHALAAGPVTITATSEGQSGTASLTIVPVPVATVTVSPASGTIEVGETIQLAATLRAGNGDVLAGRPVAWSTSDPAITTVTTDGLVLAVSEGPVTITATSEGQSGTASLTIIPVPVATVTVSPVSGTIEIGSTYQLTATSRDDDGNVLTGRPVVWTSGDDATATVNSSGLVTALAAGPVTITATSEGQSGAASLTIIPVPVATVTVSPVSGTIEIGSTYQLTATSRDDDGNVLTGRPVVWTSGDDATATVNSSGLVTALAAGPVTITATSEGQSGAASLTIIPVPVATVTVNPPTATLLTAGTLQLTATLRDANGNVLTGRTVTWSTSNPGRATVSSSGLVRGIAAGPVTITATSESRSGTSSITVLLAPVATVTVTPSSATLQIGTTLQLAATLRDANGNVLTGRTVSWSTSSSRVATVNSSGRVTAVRVGTATIAATSEGQRGTSAMTVTSMPPSSVVFVGAGDIADCGSSGDEATASLLDNIAGTVFTLGDNAYELGSDEDYANCYHPSWGRHKDRTRPTPGNHEYYTSGAAGYFNYFGANAGPGNTGYYSFNLGNWHIISLNSNITMSAGSTQEQWLRADLAANTRQCTLAYWHHPRFSSGSHGSTPGTQALWQALYDFNAEIVLAGHDHNYQRFAPMTAQGTADATRGLRSFVVGTGGADHYDFSTPIANTEAYNTDTNGVLKLTLYANSYAWQFIPEAGRTYADSGTGNCH